jgi:hypothetical protein
MHGAPSVSYPVGRCRFAAVLAASLWLAGLLALAAWTAQAPGPGWRQGLAAAALAAGAVAAGAAWWRGPRGTLRWEGGQWSWQDGAGGGDAPSGSVHPRLDLQRWLLVAWRGEPGTARWLWLERERAPSDWEALRRAVYSRARTEGPRRQEPPPAEP